MSCTNYSCVCCLYANIFYSRALICVPTFFFPPTSRQRELGGGTYPFIDWLSSPPASGEERDRVCTRFLHSQMLKFTHVLPPWWITLQIFFFLSVNYPYIVSTLPGELLVFEVELCFGGGEKSPWKAIYPLPSTATFSLLALPDIFNRLLFSSPGVLLLHLNFLQRFHHLLTHPLHLTLLLLPVPPVLLSFSVLHHTLITSSIVRIKCEGRPRSCCLNLPIMEPKGIWNWVWRLHQGHLLHPTG